MSICVSQQRLLQDLEADLVLWTTGSQPSSKAKASMDLPFPCNDKGAMKTYDTLQIVGNPHVFALGDLASSAEDGQQLEALPATAQVSACLYLVNCLALQCLTSCNPMQKGSDDKACPPPPKYTVADSLETPWPFAL